MNALLKTGLCKRMSAADAQGVLALVSRACDPSRVATLAKRRQALSSGLAELVEADAWVACLVAPASRAQGGPFEVVDGAWRSPRQRPRFGAPPPSGVHGLLTDAGEVVAPDAQTCSFRRTGPIAHDGGGATPSADGLWGWEWLVSRRDAGVGLMSIVGLCRMEGRPPFDARDRAVVHVVWQHTTWLHQRNLAEPAGSKTVALSAREREVLTLLIDGVSRKEVATQLGLSVHTVGDHMKSIYRKLNVRSQVELLNRIAVMP